MTGNLKILLVYIGFPAFCMMFTCTNFAVVLTYWQLDFDKNEENKKKVVTKVVDFSDFGI